LYLTFSVSICQSGTGVCDPLYGQGLTPNGPPAALTDQCVGSLSLGKGQITVWGLVDWTGPVPVTIAITGGTGAHRTAHGELQTSGPVNQQRRRAAHPEAHPLAEHQP
jgi:hypothetical protein